MKIFIDLDGPVLDVTDRYYAIYEGLLRKSGYGPLTMDEYWDCKRHRMAEAAILRKTCPESFVEPYSAERLRLIENREYLGLDTLQDGAMETLRQWQSNNSLFIVTLRKDREALLRQLESLRIMDLFSGVFSEPDNDGGWKTKYNMISRHVEEPENCLVIGDTEVDIKAGKELGTTTVALTCGIRTRELLLATEPDYIFDSLSDVPLERLTVAKRGAS